MLIFRVFFVLIANFSEITEEEILLNRINTALPLLKRVMVKLWHTSDPATVISN